MSALRNFGSYKNIHAGETLIVCGCGKSLYDFDLFHEFVTVGVNDVGRHIRPNYLLVLNAKEQFLDDRFSYVESSRADAVFTQLDLDLSHPNVINMPLGIYEGTAITQNPGIHYTKNSPYAAVNLAVYMGARSIGLIGVDFAEDHFFARTGIHHLTADLPNIDRQYSRLCKTLARHDIELVNLSQRSRLMSIPRVSGEAFCRRAREGL